MLYIKALFVTFVNCSFRLGTSKGIGQLEHTLKNTTTITTWQKIQIFASFKKKKKIVITGTANEPRTQCFCNLLTTSNQQTALYINLTIAHNLAQKLSL